MLVLAPTAVLTHLSLLVMLKAVVLPVRLHYVNRFLHSRLDLPLLRLLVFRRTPISLRHIVKVLGCLCEEDLLLHILRVNIGLICAKICCI